MALTDPASFHRGLAHFNTGRLAFSTPTGDWREELQTDLVFRLMEGEYLEDLRLAVAPLVNDGTAGVEEFMSWFDALEQTGPGQHHHLFDLLEHEATMEQIRWFLSQEAAGEAGFDDLIAYTQVSLPIQPKLECARNFWDELGHGKEAAMHGQMLARMVAELDLRPEIDTTVWESLALANTMLGLATSRKYAYHSIGALGIVELTAPGRVGKVSSGMERLGIDRRTRTYFDVHAAVDIRHSRDWNREVVRPLITQAPECAAFIAEGALMRLVCGMRCFDRYAAEFSRNEFAGTAPHRQVA